MNKIGQIGSNGVEEFFEEITFGLGNSFDIVSALPDTDIELINEAMSSGVSIMKMGVMMMVLQQQEAMLEKIMSYLFAGIGVTIASGSNLLKKGLRRFKGTKLIKRLSLFTEGKSDSINYCRLGTEVAMSKINIKNSVNSATDRYNVSINQRRSMVENENHKLQLAKGKSDAYNQTLMLKMFSGGFTNKDKVLLKRILGKDSTVNLDIDDLNKISSFMWTKDNNGNVVGLSEEFMSLINGLGYLQKG